MNPEAQKVLNAILKKSISELTQSDIRFLHARWDYLTDEQREQYFDVINDFRQQKPSEPLHPSDSTFSHALQSLKYRELIQYAKDRNIAAKIGMKKDEIIQLIQDQQNV